MSSSVGVRLANVPWMATALKRCIVIDSRWKSNALSRESSDSWNLHNSVIGQEGDVSAA